MPLARTADEALARLVAAGQERAFAAIYERYHQPLYGYARSIVRHEADAQDVLQTAFGSAFSALRAGRRDAPLRPWLFRIVHNEAISVLRRRRPEVELGEAMPGSAPAAEDTAVERERLRHLIDDLRQLPERQRAALTLRELSGLSHEDVAHVLQCSPGAAKQTIFEARRALAELQEGRAMDCDDVCRLISDGDGRVLRGRRVRAHLRGCPACAAFAAAIPQRSAELRALVPVLPPAAAGLLLTRALRHAGLRDAGRATAGLAGKASAGATVAKVTAGVVAATSAVGVAHLALGHPRSGPAEPPPAQSSLARPARAGVRYEAVHSQVVARLPARHQPRPAPAGHRPRAAAAAATAVVTAGGLPSDRVARVRTPAGGGDAGVGRAQRPVVVTPRTVAAAASAGGAAASRTGHTEVAAPGRARGSGPGASHGSGRGRSTTGATARAAAPGHNRAAASTSTGRGVAHRAPATPAPPPAHSPGSGTSFSSSSGRGMGRSHTGSSASPSAASPSSASASTPQPATASAGAGKTPGGPPPGSGNPH